MDSIFPLDHVLDLIWKQFGSPWLAIALIGGYALHWTGLIGHLFGARERAFDREAQRERDNDERQDRLITALIAEADGVRRRWAADVADFERRLNDAHRRADEATLNSQRWRHLCGTFGIAAAHRGKKLDEAGISYERIDFSRFIKDGGDPSEFEGIV